MTRYLSGNATGSLAPFENKDILFNFEERCSPPQRWHCSCKFIGFRFTIEVHKKQLDNNECLLKQRHLVFGSIDLAVRARPLPFRSFVQLRVEAAQVVGSRAGVAEDDLATLLADLAVFLQCVMFMS
jgi:hypothetical protein